MQIYFVRHGRTQFNLEHRFQGGDSDSPLVESGILGGKAAGKRLQAVQFEAVYSSPQKRAFDTAQYIVEANQWQPDIQVEPRLREMRFGRWDGLLEAEAEPKTQVDMLINHPERYQPELAGQGETYADFVARTTAAVHDAVAQAGVQSDKPLLMVSHGLVTTMTIKALLGIPIAQFRKPLYLDGQLMSTIGHGIVDNDSLTILKTDDNQTFKVKTWNETDYLDA
ncbi:alpha-ribazole-5'-phosphate phosphatase (putative) [Lactobacillus plantarum JDM1] [Lactiplantibacillus mudanjiangensis]|uniref:histidine phosphatase family protein n=1 Tax=Lactiplantibacillus mudanjiangensis TaxID=1296538 RepID=UPI00101411E8|nr:histidine phosphatase family protein [Lactiplantibacillus mudanjiangensis]VDG32558.1 alpha-ribazole-5'-phosphate phosphatase (putative) [Lactobacillus plantarum JDM1] [Lactiplantibacillus mudanjiangensis]